MWCWVSVTTVRSSARAAPRKTFCSRLISLLKAYTSVPATLRKASDIERSVVASVTSPPWAANPDFVSCRSRSRAALPMVGSSDSIGDCSSSLIAPGLFSPEEIWQSLRSCLATSWSAARFGAAEHSAATAHAQEIESTSLVRWAGRRCADIRLASSNRSSGSRNAYVHRRVLISLIAYSLDLHRMLIASGVSAELSSIPLIHGQTEEQALTSRKRMNSFTRVAAPHRASRSEPSEPAPGIDICTRFNRQTLRLRPLSVTACRRDSII